MTQIVGPSVVGQVNNVNGQGSNVQTFINFLSSPATQIPLESDFLIAIENIPGAFQNGGTFPDGFENQWSVNNTLNTILNSLQSTAQTPLGGQICLWAQGFVAPGETIDSKRIDNVPTGGLITGIVTQARTPYNNLELAILETNASFVDFVIRPWVSLVGHYGLITRSPTSTQNVKTTLTCVLFDKNNQNNIRKIYTYRGAAPVNVSPLEYTYDTDGPRIIRVNFVFNTYSIQEPSSQSSW